MRDVLIALVPAIIAALVVFKVNALINIVICVAVAVAAEWVICKIMKKEPTIKDFSAALTGLFVALVLPPVTPWFTLIIAVFIAVVIVKVLMGGLGRNIFQPGALRFRLRPALLRPHCHLDPLSGGYPRVFRRRHRGDPAGSAQARLLRESAPSFQPGPALRQLVRRRPGGSGGLLGPFRRRLPAL